MNINRLLHLGKISKLGQKNFEKYVGTSLLRYLSIQKKKKVYDKLTSNYLCQTERMSELRFMSLQNFINYTIFNQNKSNQMHPLDIDVTNPMPKELPHYLF